MVINSSIQSQKKFQTVNDFLISYDRFKGLDFEQGITFEDTSKSDKMIPSIQIATLQDAKEIAQIFREIYSGTYSYKEMENEDAIRKMIIDPSFYWIVYKINTGEVIGCTGFHVDLNRKSGTIHGFVIKKEYQGLTDLGRLSIACLYSFLKKYEKRVLVWSCEVRTGHTKSQYMARILGLLPIAFLPNKDLFFLREESQFIYILYDEEALSKYRSMVTPRIHFKVMRSYLYAQEKLNLELPIANNHFNEIYDESELNLIRKNVLRRYESTEFGNQIIKLTIKGRKSYFKFFQNCYINNIEQTIYKITKKEELKIFLEEVKKLIEELKIRYFEAFVSAYDSIEQKIFLEAGFQPFGYIPAYKFNPEIGMFEDQVLFIFQKKEVNLKNLKMLGEPREFLKTIQPFWDI